MGAFGLLSPIAAYDTMPLSEANRLLVAWGHKMGPCNRPAGMVLAHGMRVNEHIVGVTITADFVNATCAGFRREDGIELARVCAAEPWVNRVLVRLWREVVLPAVSITRGRPLVGLSYQDAKLHVGDLYRFDGWAKIAFSHSGMDRNSGRAGRDKFIWAWPPETVVLTPPPHAETPTGKDT